MTKRPDIIDELKAGLEGVTLGKWQWEAGRPDVTTYWNKKTWTILQVKSTSLGWHENSMMASREAERNAAHIARCSPDNIAALIAYIEQVEAERDDEKVRELEARVAELEGALRPFAEVPYVGRAFNRAHLSEWDFRKARAAMETKDDE